MLLSTAVGNLNNVSGTGVKSAEVKLSVACLKMLRTCGKHMICESCGSKSIPCSWSRHDSLDMAVLLLAVLSSVK